MAWGKVLNEINDSLVELRGRGKISVDVSVDGCSSSLAIGRRPVEGAPRFSPEVNWDRLQLIRNPNEDVCNRKRDERMD